MRISLLYGEHAGRGVSIRQLRERLARGGHEILRIVEKSRSDPLLDASTELVVAAGGDGTVSAAARAVAGRGVPLAILPLGTANNIARSIGMNGSVSEIIESWENARRLPFDIGIASGEWGEHSFLESAGGGLVSAGIAAMQNHAEDEQEKPACRLSAAVRRYTELLWQVKPRHWKLTLDATPMRGDFLLLEVLNTPSIGPNLVLTPDANPSDGFFAVVTAGEEHREALSNYLRHRLEGRDVHLALPTRRARQIEIEAGDEMHADSSLCPWAAAGTTSVRIEPAALQFLAAG